MSRPEIHHRNGYQVIKWEDGKWRVQANDGPLSEPFEHFSDAEKAAEKLPPKGDPGGRMK